MKSVRQKLLVPIMVIAALFLQSGTNAQTGNQSCEAGGEMWVCGKQQQLQAHKDFDDNCGDDYVCGETLRVIIDICSPDERRTEIFADRPGCPPVIR